MTIMFTTWLVLGGVLSIVAYSIFTGVREHDGRAR